MKRTDLTGQRFGRLVIERYHGRSNDRHPLWACACDCGDKATVLGKNLKNGRTRSCGCLKRETDASKFTTHGMANTRIYGVWATMLQRCLNPRSPKWSNYGGRGIIVCDRWRSFENFYADMGDPPFLGATLDRIDGDSAYTPANCRWTTQSIQTRNRRGNVHITFDGVSQVLQDWAKDLGISQKTLSDRYHRGDMPPHLFRPVDTRFQHRSVLQEQPA